MDLPSPTRRAVIGALPLLPLLGACGGAPIRRRGRGLLLLVVDALRYDHTSFAGLTDNTPRLAAWAEREAIVFDDAWSAAPSLVPAHVSLLTGCDPHVSRTPRVVLSDGRAIEPLTPWTIPGGVPSLAEELVREGWTTAAFIDHRFPVLRGLQRGFMTYDAYGGSESELSEPGLARVCLRLYRWLQALDDDADWFAYVHLSDLEVVWDVAEWERRKNPDLRLGPLRPELDWVPPIGARSPLFHALPPSRALPGQPPLSEYEARYDAALSWIDGSLVRLFKMLEGIGRFDRTTAAVVGSFGLSFGESGLLVSSGTPTDVDLRVPLLLRPAPELGLGVGTRRGELVSGLDLAPTLLQLADIPVPAGLHGRSTVPLLRGRAEAVRERTFASHGELDGFCAVDEERLCTVLRPGARRGASNASWFGEERRHTPLEVIVERRRVPGPGRGLEQPRREEGVDAADLREAALAWYADLELAREVLHPSAWNADKRGAAIVAELRAKGLVGD